jgi:hypothetical protein
MPNDDVPLVGHQAFANFLCDAICIPRLMG